MQLGSVTWPERRLVMKVRGSVSVIRQVVSKSIYDIQWGLINFKMGGQRRLPCFTKEETEAQRV